MVIQAGTAYIEDAKRADRRKAIKRLAPKVIFGGETFPLSFEMPYLAVEAIKDNDDNAFLQILLGQKYGAFVAHGLTVPDIEALTTFVLKAYGYIRTPQREANSTPTTSGNAARPKRSGAKA